MITINLLRQKQPKHTGTAVSVGRMLMLLAAVAGVIAVAAGGYYGISRWMKLSRAGTSKVVTASRPVAAPVAAEKQPIQTPAATAAAVKPSPETAVAARAEKAPVPAAEEEKGYRPSTHVASQMVEEVVKDVDAAAPGKAVELADLTYAEMSRGEQINYEFVFTRNVLQILTRAAPAGIGFTSLSIDSFRNVSAAGFAPSREQMTALFENLRREKIEMLDPPGSSIRPAGNQGYRFSFTGSIRFGVNQAESWQLTDHLDNREGLRNAVESLSQRLSDAGLSKSKPPAHLETRAAGVFRQSIYRLSGSGTYRAFVRFVLDANGARIPCAFSNVRLKARSGGSVDFSANAVFTTRN